MENNETSQQAAVDNVYQYAAGLLITEKRPNYEVIDALTSQGLDAESAFVVVDNLEGQIKKAKKEQANKDMLWGAVWCVGGTIATLSNIGFIFWGAIVFGGIQFFKGLVNAMNDN